MSGESAVIVDRELIDQVLLQRSHADDEEAAEADGEQHDPHLAAGPAQLQHRVTQRERSRSRQRLESRGATGCRQGAARSRWRQSPPATSEPMRSEPACHTVNADQAGNDDHA